MLETPRLRFPNTPKQLAIFLLTDRYITETSLSNFSLSTTKRKSKKDKPSRKKKKHCVNGFSHNVLSNVFSLVNSGVFQFIFHGAGFFRYNHPSKEKRGKRGITLDGFGKIDRELLSCDIFNHNSLSHICKK